MLKKIVSLALVASTFFALQALALTPEQLEAVNLYKSGRYDLAAQRFITAAKAGDAFSQSMLATLYTAGRATEIKTDDGPRVTFEIHTEPPLDNPK